MQENLQKQLRPLIHFLVKQGANQLWNSLIIPGETMRNTERINSSF